MQREELNNKFWNVELHIKEIMLLLMYPKLSRLIYDASIIFNLSHHMRFSNNYNASFSIQWHHELVLTS